MIDRPGTRKERLPVYGHRLLLLAILLLAAVLRLTRLDLAEFKSDEAGIAREALALVHEGQFPLAGPSSSQGPAHPPLHIYLMALPFALSQDPRLAVSVVALIHTGAVLMAYLLGARFFQRRVGLIAAFLFAINPWAIYYARKMWTQNWPLATTLFIFCLLLFVRERRPGALAGASLALVALAGTHLGGLAFVVVLILVLLLFPSRVERRALLAAVLIFALFAVPYLYHDATHDWVSVRGLLGLGDGQVQMDLDALRFAAWLSSGYHYQDLTGVRHEQFLESLPNLHWLDVAEMVLLGAGLVYLAARIARHALAGRERWRESAGRDVIMLSWLLVPVFLQIRHSQPVYPHYFILLYPAQHLVVALLLSDGLSWLRCRIDKRLGQWCVVGLAAAIIAVGVWQIYVEQSFVRFVARHDTPDGYGPVAGPLWRAASRAGEIAIADGAEVLVVTPGDNPIWDNLPSAFDVLLPYRLPRRFVDGRKALVFPTTAGIYVVTSEVNRASEVLRRQTGATLVERVDTPGEKPIWIFERSNVSRDDVLAEMTSLAEPRRLSNGVEVLAYRIESELQSAGTIQLSLAWWLDGPPPPDTDFHSFAHLVDASGDRWGQHDLSSFPAASWQAGDLVLTLFQIEVDAGAPPGEYWLRLGMYTFPDIVNVPVVDVASNPVTDAIVIGPFSLR